MKKELCKLQLCELQDYSEVLCILDKISIFGGLTRKQLGVIFKELKKMSIKKDEVIFTQGGSPGNIYIIQNGGVKIVEELSSESLELIRFSTGDCFGETELIGIFPYIASAVATEDTNLIVFPRKALRVLYKEHLPIFTIIILNIARESCRRLAQADKRMFEMIEKNQKLLDLSLE